MSNLLEYIKGLRKRGLSDYQILMAAKIKDRETQTLPQYGGQGEEELMMQQYSEGQGLDPQGMYDVVEDEGGVDITAQEVEPLDAEPVSAETVLVPPSQQEQPGAEVDTTDRTEYTTIKAGSILYHPSASVRQISDDHPIFVNIDEVLDSKEQRTFTMFFTPNREYARRFSGISSLNKRNVYVHKLRAKTDITGIRRINGKLISQETDNVNLASGFCGPNADTYVNGIEITYETISGDIQEYYICNPERFFSLESTEMMFDATTWVDITEGDKIFVPKEGYQETEVTLGDEMDAADDLGVFGDDDLPAVEAEALGTDYDF